MSDTPPVSGSPRVVFAYDGSDLAKAAIDEAGRQLTTPRKAVVATVWEPLGVNTFFPAGAIPVDAKVVEDLEKGAGKMAAEGAALAEAAGFRADTVATEGSPIWRRIVDVAEELKASLIVLGSHGRTGVSWVMLGSVAGGVAQHFGGAVLIVHGTR